MKDIRDLLKEGDPIGREFEPGAEHFQRMRRVVMAAHSAERNAPWPNAVLVAATLVGAIAVSIAVGRQLPAGDDAARGSTVGGSRLQDAAPVPAPPQQLQFETAGGTRIIWVFDPNFKL